MGQESGEKELEAPPTVGGCVRFIRNPPKRRNHLANTEVWWKKVSSRQGIKGGAKDYQNFGEAINIQRERRRINGKRGGRKKTGKRKKGGWELGFEAGWMSLKEEPLPWAEC